MGLNACQMCAMERCVPGSEVYQGSGHSRGQSLWHGLVGGCVGEAEGGFALPVAMSPEGRGSALCRVTTSSGNRGLST